jgi:hypothetical protein
MLVEGLKQCTNPYSILQDLESLQKCLQHEGNRTTQVLEVEYAQDFGHIGLRPSAGSVLLLAPLDAAPLLLLRTLPIFLLLPLLFISV